MFTGIIECLGRVKTISKGPKTAVSLLVIRAPGYTRGIKIGASVAVNGVCLTAVKVGRDSLGFHVVTETKRRSNLGALKAGDPVNLERPLKYNGRVEGHFVLGHVDAVGRVLELVRQKKQASFRIEFPTGLKRYILEKGSVCINGVSLTVGVVAKNSFWVHCIPHTLKLTNFGHFMIGDPVNLEADILIKFFKTL
ncbi:MAG: riboflavin synthase [Candidatus Omnitrophota bacterium]